MSASTDGLTTLDCSMNQANAGPQPAANARPIRIFCTSLVPS